MKIICQKAGFREEEGLYYNPRVTVYPSQSLMERVFPWLTVTLSSIITDGFPAEDKFMVTLTQVVLQDAAFISIKHPNCLYQPLFVMDVFQSDEFKLFVEVMRASLASCTSPFDASLETECTVSYSSSRPRIIIPKPSVDT
jgi:hypothetical protein